QTEQLGLDLSSLGLPVRQNLAVRLFLALALGNQIFFLLFILLRLGFLGFGGGFNGGLLAFLSGQSGLLLLGQLFIGPDLIEKNIERTVDRLKRIDVA